MNHDFERAWQKLATEGLCDDHGGAEYRRVRDEFIAAGQPADAEAFIREHANANSDGYRPIADAKKRKEK